MTLIVNALTSKYASFVSNLSYHSLSLSLELIMDSSSSSLRFPFISCEIFTCEIAVILKTLVEDDEVIFFIHHFTFSTTFSFFFASHLWFNFILQLMDLLFSFLEPNRSHSALLAGYFSKVLSLLYKFSNWPTSRSYLFLFIYIIRLQFSHGSTMCSLLVSVWCRLSFALWSGRLQRL